jgi:hypothetical protein
MLQDFFYGKALLKNLLRNSSYGRDIITKQAPHA